MKHSVLFIIPQLTHGGSNRSLQSIFACFPESDWAVYSLDASTDTSLYSSVFEHRLLDQGKIYNFCVTNTLVRKALNACANYLHIDLWPIVYTIEADRIKKLIQCETVVGFEESYATLFA